MKALISKIFVWIANYVLKKLRNGIGPNFSREEYRFAYFSFSQFGEDLAVERWVNMLDIKNGVYVDVGAFDPIRCSNTLMLHRRGWLGVNVDMEPERIDKFHNQRPDDFNVVAAVSDEVREDTILKFEAGATDRLASTTSSDFKSYGEETDYETRQIITETLDSILARCPFAIESIDYLTIDAEGHDMAVLRGLDFERYCPSLVTVEAFTEKDEAAISDFFQNRGYRLIEKNFCSTLFLRNGLEPDFKKVLG